MELKKPLEVLQQALVKYRNVIDSNLLAQVLLDELYIEGSKCVSEEGFLIIMWNDNKVIFRDLIFKLVENED